TSRAEARGGPSEQYLVRSTWTMRHGAHAVEALTKLLARGERDGGTPWQLHGSPRLGVAAQAGRAGLEREAAEPAQLDALPCSQRLGHAFEDGVDDGLDTPRRNMRGLPRDERDE